MQKFEMETSLNSDVEELVLLINSAYRGESSKKGWTTEADLIEGDRMNADMLTDMVRRNDVIIRKCLDNQGNIVGCVCLEIKQHELYLGLLTVSPEIQAKGIGKLILSDAEEIALKQGIAFISLSVISLRKELIDYYVRRGFILTGEKFQFPVDNKFGSRPLQQLELLGLKKNLKAQKR